MHLENQLATKFNDTFCGTTSEFTWVRGIDLRFKYTTTTAAKMSGFKNFDDLIGLTTYDIKAPVVQSAAAFDRQLNKVARSNQSLHTLDIHTFEDNDLQLFMTTLLPVYNNQGAVSCVFGKCLDLNQTNNQALSAKLIHNYAHLIELRHNISLSLELIDTYEQLNLTVRESECFYFVIRGRSNSEIGKLLYISPRTVDDHINSIKAKLGLTKRSDIIDFAITLDLIPLLPRSLIHQ